MINKTLLMKALVDSHVADIGHLTSNEGNPTINGGRPKFKTNRRKQMKGKK